LKIQAMNREAIRSASVAGLRRETAAHLLNATLRMGCFGATQKLLSQTKYYKVGSYDTGR